MNRKAIAILLTAQLMLTTAGCSSMFEDTYTSSTDFKGSQELELDADTEVVKSYSALRRRIFSMVNNHEETAHLLISGYSGDVASDIASICGSVNIDSALGAYCVEYVSYDLTQIVSYYEAEIRISYKYTREELENLVTVANNSAFSDAFAQQVTEGREHMVFKVNNGIVDDAAVTELIQQSCRDHPMAISYIPEVSVKVYSGSGSQKIYDVSVSYGSQYGANAARLSALANAVANAKRSIPASSDAWMVINAARYLGNNCVVLEDGGSTAYDALVECTADSEGMAVAFKALCDKLGVECQVISGKMDKNPHFWNIVRVEDAWYHVDVSELLEKGGEEALFLNDSQKSATCWWNLTDYPACEGSLTYSSIVEPGTETEPSEV